MKLSGKFKFMGVESRVSFRDPSKVTYVLGLSQGLDTLRLYIEAPEFAEYSRIEPYTDVEAVLDYNPVADKVAYCIRLAHLEW